MRRYFLSVILAALFGGVCEEVLPENSSVRPYMKLVTGICVLAVLVLPLKDFLIGLGSFFTSVELESFFPDEGDLHPYESVFEESLSRFSVAEAEDALAELLIERFQMQEGSCRAEIRIGEAGEVTHVLVCLSGFSMLKDPREVGAFVSELLSCPCDVAVE